MNKKERKKRIDNLKESIIKKLLKDRKETGTRIWDFDDFMKMVGDHPYWEPSYWDCMEETLNLLLREKRILLTKPRLSKLQLIHTPLLTASIELP